MNADEVKRFLVEHKRLHPDFAKWSNELTETSRRSLFELWCESLLETTLEAAVAVSRKLANGDIAPPDGWAFGRDYNSLGGFVRKQAELALRQSFAGRFNLSGSCNRTGKELTYRCHHCRDTGYREVYHPNSVAAVSAGLIDIADKRQRRRLHVCSLLCDCDAGRAILEAQPDKWSESQVFHPNRWCECPRGDVVEHADGLKSWIEAVKDVRNRPNYSHDLAAYNED